MSIYATIGFALWNNWKARDPSSQLGMKMRKKVNITLLEKVKRSSNY